MMLLKYLQQRLRPPRSPAYRCQLALAHRDLDALRVALESGEAAQINTPIEASGVRLLHIAVEECQDAITMLLDHGANPCLVDGQGHSPLAWAFNPDFHASLTTVQTLRTAMYQRQVQDETAVLNQVAEAPSNVDPTPANRRSRL